MIVPASFFKITEAFKDSMDTAGGKFPSLIQVSKDVHKDLCGRMLIKPGIKEEFMTIPLEERPELPPNTIRVFNEGTVNSGLTSRLPSS